MKKINGFQEALKILQQLDLAKQQELLADMARKDPELVIQLKQKLITFDDLKYLTPTMMRRLQQDIPLETFGLALRGAEAGLVKHILSLVSQNNQHEINEILKGKLRPLNDVLEAQNKIMQLVLKLHEKGEIILSKDKSSQWV